MTRIAINGLGRIGKLVLRALTEDPGAAELVLLNDAVGDAAAQAHFLEFDSVHGRWGAALEVAGDGLVIDGRQVALTTARAISDLPLRELSVDLVLDCTGAHRDAAGLDAYFDGGAARVLVSAPVKDGGALNLVRGVNDHLFNPAAHRIVTAASCTTNCLGPVVKVLHEGIGIRHGSITTIHDATNTQTVTDRPMKDARRARSALLNLIPTTTGSASAIGLIFPELAGRLNGHAVRVPLLNASITDCVFEMGRETDAAEVNGLLRAAAEGPLAGVLGYEDRPLVSSDYRGDRRSAVVDGLSTMVVGGTQVKVYAWYDNETGYAWRMAELARMLS